MDYVKKLDAIVTHVEASEKKYLERIQNNPSNSTLSLAHSEIALIKYDLRALLEGVKYDRPLSNVIGVEEASELWNLSAGYIKNLCAEGKIICKKIGKTWVIDKNQPNPSNNKE